MLANVQRCWAVPFVPINFTVPCTGVLSSATHLLAYRWSAGEIVLPGQSFHQWTHLGKETSAHLGPFTTQGYRIINSWSEIMAEVLSLKQFLRVKRGADTFLTWIARFCCQRESNCSLVWWITAAKALFHAEAKWHLQALSHHEQLLITLFYSRRASVK